MKRGRKKTVGVTLDPEVVKEARELGLNISMVCEKALIDAIKRVRKIF